jgi:hypothetical protein
MNSLFILAVTALLALTVTMGLASNLPLDPTQKGNYRIAAAFFGLIGYGAQAFLCFQLFRAATIII